MIRWSMKEENTKEIFRSQIKQRRPDDTMVNERGKYQRDNQKPISKEDQMIRWSMKEEHTKEIIRSQIKQRRPDDTMVNERGTYQRDNQKP